MKGVATLDSAALAAIAGMPAIERSNFFDRHEDLLGRDIVQRLTTEVATVVRSDMALAERLVEAAQWIAERLADPVSLGRAARAAGHVAHVSGRHLDSLLKYEEAIDQFLSCGDDLEAAITQNNAITPLIYTGAYKMAFAFADEARAVFTRRGETLRLARVDMNLGAALFRLDRIEEARDHYERAHGYVKEHGSPSDRALTLRNLTVCYISLNDYDRALEYYTQARDHCREHQLWRLLHENDYNIAYLYYLRGEYTRAIEMYDATRRECDRQDDAYHRALCDLDQSELYLELNLTEEGEELAQSAFTGFERLEMRYEAAKALTFLAIAASQTGKAVRALQLFDNARARFVAEGNAVWPALIDLYRAIVLFEESRHLEAARYAAAALAAFDGPAFATKAALAELLIARVRLACADTDAASRACQSALDRIAAIDSPGSAFQAHVVRGQIHERRAERTQAFACYEKALAALETLRSHLGGDELKIAFLKNKLTVFESLVQLLLTGADEAGVERAFGLIEQAKSRSLADLISFRAHALPPTAQSRSDFVDRMRRIREELNWYYHQIDLEQLKHSEASGEKVAALRTETRERERQLVRLVDQVRSTDREFHSLQQGSAIPLDAIRASLPADSLILEFYEARGVVYAAIVGRDRLEIRPVTSGVRIREGMRLLTFQMAKFRLGDEYVRRFGANLQTATHQHLQEMYREIIEPIRGALDASHLVIVPHDCLHHLPFHALHDGQRFMCDDYSISYAPSASVFHLCCSKPAQFDDSSLVLGVSDRNAPHITHEARSVAELLPNARLYLDDEVTPARLQDEGRHSRFVHIAAHGYFRQDNPMFSSIKLGQSQLTLYDLYRLQLSAELVSLSGCGTALNVVVAGDELLGLTRGLLYAGAHALLLTLWEVNDRTTADFMTRFYRELQAEPANTAAALTRAMQAIREACPHPYYWAPFVLSGKFTRQQPTSFQ